MNTAEQAKAAELSANLHLNTMNEMVALRVRLATAEEQVKLLVHDANGKDRLIATSAHTAGAQDTEIHDLKGEVKNLKEIEGYTKTEIIGLNKLLGEEETLRGEESKKLARRDKDLADLEREAKEETTTLKEEMEEVLSELMDMRNELNTKQGSASDQNSKDRCLEIITNIKLETTKHEGMIVSLGADVTTKLEKIKAQDKTLGEHLQTIQEHERNVEKQNAVLAAKETALDDKDLLIEKHLQHIKEITGANAGGLLDRWIKSLGEAGGEDQ